MFQAIELEINSMCNRRCSYCPNDTGRRPSGYMTDTLFRKIIGELGQMDFDGNVSYHFYGEPLLDKRLLEFVRYTADNVPKCRPVIYSNGDFLTLELFREYVAAGVGLFLITQHDNTVPANLDEILRNATPAELDHITVGFASATRMTNRSGLIKTLSVRGRPIATPCDWPLATFVITMRGNVVPCCNDYYETSVVGNVETHSLAEVWCSPGFEAFRDALSRGDRGYSPLCANCDYQPTPTQLERIVARS